LVFIVVEPFDGGGGVVVPNPQRTVEVLVPVHVLDVHVHDVLFLSRHFSDPQVCS